MDFEIPSGFSQNRIHPLYSVSKNFQNFTKPRMRLWVYIFAENSVKPFDSSSEISWSLLQEHKTSNISCQDERSIIDFQFACNVIEIFWTRVRRKIHSTELHHHPYMAFEVICFIVGSAPSVNPPPSSSSPSKQIPISSKLFASLFMWYIMKCVWKKFHKCDVLRVENRSSSSK